MSFVGKKNTSTEILKMKEKKDENLKITIDEKIFAIMTRNMTIREKIGKINQKNYLIREDEDFLEQLINETKSNIDSVNKLIREFESIIQKKYSQDIDMKDKLFLIKQQMNKTIDKEVENFNKNLTTFQNIRTSLSKTNEKEFTETNELINDKNDEDLQKFKVSDKQIKYMEDISNYRKNKYEHFYTQTLMVQKITNDINQLTHHQDKKIEQIGDNIVPILTNSKETFKMLLETSNNDQKFKSNNCWIIAIIVFGLFFLLLITINFNR